jgi:quercetin dioxygenase-like cupin family protein
MLIKEMEVKMNKIDRFSRIAFLTAAISVSGFSCAQADDSTILKFPQDIKYTSSGKGVETAVIYGDPSKPGLYVIRLKLPAGAKVMPHIHPGEVRTMTVLSGTLYFGFGNEFDETKLKAYPPGTFFTELSTTPHFVSAKDGEVIFQASGIGPSGMVDAH